jgi:hypothetical protein
MFTVDTDSEIGKQQSSLISNAHLVNVISVNTIGHAIMDQRLQYKNHDHGPIFIVKVHRWRVCSVARVC